MKKKLLIIEDELSIAKQLKWGLADTYEVIIAGTVDEARELLASRSFPVATLDLGLPPTPDIPEQGFQLLEAVPVIAPESKIIVITGNAEKENAIRAIALGAVDFYSKPIDMDLLKIILDRTYKIYELENASRMDVQASEASSLCGMIGISQPMRDLFKLIRQASVTDYPVLIGGESGTGKEMAAWAVHQLSQRSKNPMGVINCGAIPENLIESELFGHEKGSFTGATARKIGKLEQVNKGTIFLDEIGDMPLTSQVKLLRFLQEGTIERVGGNETIKLDVRVIAATNVNLEEAVAEGRFREDLYFRLNVLSITIPPLRERQEDILLLAHNFIKQEEKRLGRGKMFLSNAAGTALIAYSWPGNVRELQNCIRRAMAMTAGTNVIKPSHLGLSKIPDIAMGRKLLTIKEARYEAERLAILRAMSISNMNISQAAKLLDVSRPTLHDLLKRHGMN